MIASLCYAVPVSRQLRVRKYREILTCRGNARINEVRKRIIMIDDENEDLP